MVKNITSTLEPNSNSPFAKLYYLFWVAISQLASDIKVICSGQASLLPHSQTWRALQAKVGKRWFIEDNYRASMRKYVCASPVMHVHAAGSNRFKPTTSGTDLFLSVKMLLELNMSSIETIWKPTPLCTSGTTAPWPGTTAPWKR